MAFRFHLLTLAHLPQSKEVMSCAFTQKNRKLAKMLTSLGHTVFFYGSEGSDVEDYCAGQPGQLVFVQTHTLADIARDYGTGDSGFNIGYDFTNYDFRHDFNSPKKSSTIKFYKACIEQINQIKRDDDFLLCTQGSYHNPIASAVKLFLTCEPGVGYRGSVKGRYRAFESSYIQNFTYGSEHPYESINGSYYDRVIPNYFDPEDIEFNDTPEDYYLFIGRMIRRKGIIAAYLTCKALGKTLVIAGQGAHVDSKGSLVPNEDPDFILPAGNWEYVGFVNVYTRKKLMSKAIATFTPTEYLECFAGTHVESMLHGTPPITTNFGVFPETIPDCLNGAVGFRCNTLDDFVNAARIAPRLDRNNIQLYAQRYLMDNVKLDFQKWFEDLHRVYLSAVNPGQKAWHYLSHEGA